MRLVILIYYLLVSVALNAQSGAELHQFFQFKDGLYMTHDALLQNQPQIGFENENPDVYINNAKILRINPLKHDLKEQESILYVVYEGLPHIRVLRCCPDQFAYVGLTVLGALSMLEYESETIIDIPMTAFNPYNGKPIYTASIQREKNIRKVSLLDMNSGQVIDILDDDAQQYFGNNSIKSYETDYLISMISAYNKDHKIYIGQQSGQK